MIIKMMALARKNRVKKAIRDSYSFEWRCKER
jgi:hypothetical protein